MDKFFPTKAEAMAHVATEARLHLQDTDRAIAFSKENWNFPERVDLWESWSGESENIWLVRGTDLVHLIVAFMERKTL